MKVAAVRQVSQTHSTPSPTKGINAFDSVVTMPPGFALLLRNFYAQPFGCMVRKGYRKHVTSGITGIVETLASQNTTSASVSILIGPNSVPDGSWAVYGGATAP